MDVPIFFAVIGGIILVGFLANLLFKLTKIPSVLLLMSIGVFIGPITGWIASDALLDIAPYFGTMALLIILFEGGLELDIMTVVRQAPKATVLAVGVFALSVVLVFGFALYVMEMTVLNALLLAAVLGATSPAICIPVVQGLSVRDEIKTIVKLESALGDVLLIVSVLLLVNFDSTGSQGFGSVVLSFVTSFGVAFVVASVAGVLWSRLIAWMGKEPLAYMLTLGFMFLLYFMVEEMHGSAAIAVLMFGLMLENMEVITSKISVRVRRLAGIDIDSEKFILNQFIKNITQELSFLLRTFFFVYLGLLLDFGELTWVIGLFIIGISALLLIGRWLMMQIFKKMSRGFTEGEQQVIMAMLPRGLATAVMALLPFQQEAIAGTEILPLYAFGIIVLTNLFMTGSVIFAERRLRGERQRSTQPLAVGYAGDVDTEILPHAFSGEDVHREAESTPASDADAASREDAKDTADQDIPPGTGPAHDAAGAAQSARRTWKDTDRAGDRMEGEAAFDPFDPKLFSSEDEYDEMEPRSFTDWMARVFGVHLGDRERGYLEAYRSAHITQPLFWIQVIIAAAITTLGLILNQSAIIIGGALVMPLMFQVLAAGLSLASGEIYLLLRTFFKILLVVLLVVTLSAILSDLLPFTEVTAEIASRTRPTIVDFLIALFGGMAGAVTISRKNRFVQFLPGAIIAITLLPPLAVMGFAIANGFSPDIFRGSALLFTANLFANILGAMIVFLLVGMPKATDLTSVKHWKEQELNHPVIQLVFEKLRLSALVGRTGSLRARLVVIGLFLLVLLIPLQSALNELTTEFRVRQAITEVSQLFDVEHRSSIINTTSRIEDDLILVKLQVATNSFFTSDDITRFEQRVADRTSIPTRLDLVQTLSDLGQGETIRGMLSETSQGGVAIGPRSFAESMGDLRFQAQSLLRTLPVSERFDVVSMNAELTLDTLSPALNFVYLSDTPMTGDARDILSTLISGHVSLPPSSIQFSWIDRSHTFWYVRGGPFSKADRILMKALHARMQKYPQLALDIAVPQGGRTPLDAAALRGDFAEVIPVIQDSLRVRITPSARRDSLIFRLRVEGNLAAPVGDGQPDTLSHKKGTQ